MPAESVLYLRRNAFLRVVYLVVIHVPIVQIVSLTDEDRMIQTGLIQNAHNDLVTDVTYDFYGLRLATCSLDQRYPHTERLFRLYRAEPMCNRAESKSGCWTNEMVHGVLKTTGR